MASLLYFIHPTLVVPFNTQLQAHRQAAARFGVGLKPVLELSQLLR